ncbi:fucose mutarotase-like isoform X2 [Physella acuta]|nr:fucose mutarotase-like isoform X2 [Physella acuta]XP_059160142.1 fucose mutarotase-like isoform X2 [Physella acuta]XP_059160143.1 fucose mutarotase-like isoform X2 [Physella acuta]
MPLKGIPNQLSPELLKTLAEMGHGDEIILADIHFPSASICSHGPKQIRADGLSATVLLEAIMQLFPLDQYVDYPVARMDLVSSDKEKGLKTPIWDKYQEILDAAEKKKVQIQYVERFDFYERAKKAFAIVHTGENQQYANIILKKGCLV